MRPRRLPAFLCCLLLPLLGSGSEAGRKAKLYRIAGVTEDAEGKKVPAEILTFSAAGVTLAIRHLDGPSRRAALASVLGREVDLFSERTETTPGHLVFALEIRNRAAGDLIFEPGQSRLITHRLDAEFPLDYTMLFEEISRLPGEGISLEEIERAVYSRASTIRAGGSVRKLLVFPEPGASKYKKFEIRIGALHLPEGDLDTVFRFRKSKVEEDDKR